MFGFGQQLMQYGSNYTKKTGFNMQNKQMTSYILKESDYLFQNTSKIILPKGCKVIYKGAVKHPVDSVEEAKKELIFKETLQKDPTKDPKIYRNQPLL